MILASDLAWAKRTGGRLSRTRTAALIWNVLRLQTKSRRGGRSVPTPLAVEDVHSIIHLPDSPIVTSALAECREICDDAIALHCLRAFAWGSLIAAGRSLKPDRELFAVACLLHDLELGRTDTRTASGCSCFACAGAIRAEAFALSQGREAPWAQRLGDAIALHLDPLVPLSRGVEAHLLQAGAALDVIGTGLRDIPASARSTVLAQLPRDGFKTEIARCMGLEAKHGGNTRAAFFMSRGFASRILKSPFERVPTGAAFL